MEEISICADETEQYTEMDPVCDRKSKMACGTSDCDTGGTEFEQYHDGIYFATNH